ncbi:MAG: two-component regulator propeller domain-containing protein [Bacillota bacterium]
MGLSKSAKIRDTAAVIALLALIILGGCANPQEDKCVTFWVVSGTNRGESFARNSLRGYDAAGQLAVKANLPHYHISSLALDSQGRLWLGQAWNDAKSSNLLLIWDDDELIEKVEVGMQPEAGIIPFAGEMVAGCTEDGMGFSLWSVNPRSLEGREVVAVDKEQRDFLFLTTIAANEDYLVAAAIHDAPGPANSSHSSIWWFDREFNLCGSKYLGVNSAIWSMVPMPNGNFLLLNNSAFEGRQGDVMVSDLLIFDPRAGAIIWEYIGSGIPFRGVAEEGKYYILDRIWSSTRINAERSVTILDGDSVRTIPLPDDFGAEDIAVADGIIYLAAWQRGDNAGDGVYRLDPATGELKQIIRHSDASSVLAVPQE